MFHNCRSANSRVFGHADEVIESRCLLPQCARSRAVRGVVSSPPLHACPQPEGSHGKPHRTTKILSDARRRGGDVAARGARAAAGEATDYRVPGRGSYGVECIHHGFCGATACTRWIEGRTIAIEYRWSEGRPERVAEIAAEFVRLKVDVIVTNGPAVATLKQATSVIPIVFAVALDPVGGGLVASLAQPGGNVTGQSTQQSDLAGKRVELLRDVVPRLRRLAIILNVDYPSAVLEMGEVQAAARALGIEVATLEIRRAEDIAPAFAALKGEADALYVVVDALVVANL